MKSCCQIQENREPLEVRKDLLVETCKVCGCRHFRLKVEPGVIGVRLNPLGKNAATNRNV